MVSHGPVQVPGGRGAGGRARGRVQPHVRENHPGVLEEDHLPPPALLLRREQAHPSSTSSRRHIYPALCQLSLGTVFTGEVQQSKMNIHSTKRPVPSSISAVTQLSEPSRG